MRRWQTCAISLTLLAGLAATSHAQLPDQFTGPADVRNQRPYQALFLAFSPETAHVLTDNQSRISAQYNAVNVLIIPRQNNGVIVHEDTEIEQLALKGRRALGHGLEVSAAIPVDWRNGGYLDKLIESYHHFIHDTHPTLDIVPGREGVSAYHSQILLTDASGNVIVNAGPTVGIGDTQLTLKRSILNRSWHAVAVRGGIKLPTGNPGSLLGSGGTDWGVDLDVDQLLARRICVYGNVSYVKLQNDSHIPNRTRSSLRHGMVAIEWAATTHASWILQNDISDAAIRTGNSLADGNQTIVTLVYRYRPNPQNIWTFRFVHVSVVILGNAARWTCAALKQEVTEMKRHSLWLVPAVAAALAAMGTPANADSSAGSTVRIPVHESITSTTTSTTPVTSSSNMSASYDPDSVNALSTHDQAVAIAHQATAAGQRGDKKMAASLAAQAQALFNQAYRSTPFFAHHSGNQ